MAKISVIVPVYKVEKYIKRCVESILAQTFTDFELILVDDGSPDNCGQICEQYAAKDGRTRVLHRKNGGLSAARNTGIDWVFKYSDSEWLTFIDSDDWIHTQYLEALYLAAVEDSTAISVCSFEETNGHFIDVKQSELKSKVWTPDEFYHQHNVLATIACAKFYKKECFADIRYPEGKIHEDEFVTYKILFQHKKISFVDAPLYAYYVNRDSITKSSWNPNRLLSIEAAEEQLEYFKTNGYNQAWERRVESYVCVIANQIERLKLCDDAIRKQYLNGLRKKLRKALSKYRHQISFRNNQWIYEQAYPKIMKIYWILVAQISKRRK